MEEGTQITLDIEELGSFSGHVGGPTTDRLVPIKFDIDVKEEDHLITQIMKIYNKMTLENPAD